MSLLTPPSTSHREKENHYAGGSRVAWSSQNQYFILSNSPKGKARALQASSSTQPAKSILKKSALPMLAVPDEELRQVTPEPEDPLVDLSYLERPVSLFLAPEPAIRDRIEGYSILTARIRTAVVSGTDADASWPLFQPLRKNAQAITDALVRDLGMALIDPSTMCSTSLEDLEVATEQEEEDLCLLPSPKQSPKKKKKKGMSAEQAKCARDLCTVSHAVMRLLGLVFTLSAVYRVFSDEQLRDMLTQVLAIPLCDVLPTPNARKTCALSIWVLQNQRLPEEVLFPARDRIAYALRRGLEGELGKEGKKGSANDGLKAIHDLSMYQPETFVPAFVALLPSMLSNLLAPTLALRAQACHALGGFAFAASTMSPSVVHTRISEAVSIFLTAPSKSPRKTASPSKNSESAIVRTLRTTLNVTDPTYAAQGPVWALSVLASFAVLLGSAIWTNFALTRTISALLTLSMRNKKSSVRGLGALIWRCLAWCYFRPVLARDVDEDGEEEMEELNEAKMESAREDFWKIVKCVVEFGAGVSTVGALLSSDTADEDYLQKALSLLHAMIRKGGVVTSDAMDILKILVSSDHHPDPWDMNKLLPQSLFSASPGLLTANYESLAGTVKPIFDECPQVMDIRSLTKEELSQEWVLTELMQIWKTCIVHVESPEDNNLPLDALCIWDCLLQTGISSLQDQDDEEGIVDFGDRVVGVLIQILVNNELDLTSKVQGSKGVSPCSRSNAALKLSITREFWKVMRSAFPDNHIHAGASKMLVYLVEHEDELVWEEDSPDDARRQWATLCAEVLIVCDVAQLRAFWSGRTRAKLAAEYEPGVHSLIWGCFVDSWSEEVDVAWEGAVVLLGVPFANNDTWELSNEDLGKWERFLEWTMNKALDYGVDATSVLDSVAEVVSKHPCPAFASSTRVTDMILGHLEMSDARQLPLNVFEFVNDTLVSTYPPEPRTKMLSVWMIRTLFRVVDACPKELVLEMLQTIQEGIRFWISDEFNVFKTDEFVGEVLPLYQTSLLHIQDLPRDIEMLQSLAPLVESIFSGSSKSTAAIDSFDEFWAASYEGEAEPEGGWPENIEAYLTSKNAVPEDAAKEEAQEVTAVAENLQPTLSTIKAISTPPKQQRNVSSTSEITAAKKTSPPVGQLDHACFTPEATPPSKSSLSIVTPTTPTQSIFSKRAPSRPRKSSATPEAYHSLLLRPLVNGLSIPLTSPTRTAFSSSPKRAASPNKENVSPEVPNVMERIASTSPGKSSSILGKRRPSGGPQPSPGKRSKSLSQTFIRSALNLPGFGKDDADEDYSKLPESPSSRTVASNASGQSKSTPATYRKRKRAVMEAVEVPSLQEVYRMGSLEKKFGAESTTLGLLGHKRIVSMPELNGETQESYGKRFKKWDGLELSDSSSPLKGLEDVQLAGSDDSIMLPISLLPPSASDASSDDSVDATPHHLASPVPRRVHALDDPFSDDSLASSSPSRAHVARRKNRIFSGEQPKCSVA